MEGKVPADTRDEFSTRVGDEKILVGQPAGERGDIDSAAPAGQGAGHVFACLAGALLARIRHGNPPDGNTSRSGRFVQYQRGNVGGNWRTRQDSNL